MLANMLNDIVGNIIAASPREALRTNFVKFLRKGWKLRARSPQVRRLQKQTLSKLSHGRFGKSRGSERSGTLKKRTP